MEKGYSNPQIETVLKLFRMEKGYSNPQIETVLKLLAPMGKTLAIVPIK